MPEQNQQKRQIAYKVRINEIINGKYIKEEGWNPNYIITPEGKQFNRINLIATVVSKPIGQELSFQSINLDDGTGRISARIFEQNDIFNNVEIGDVVLLIGRPREFNNEIYLLPEIIKKVEDKLWIKVRELELKNDKTPEIIEEISDKEVQEEEIVEDIEESVAEKVIRIVKKNDKGEGVGFEDILKQVDNEGIINELLKKGEIFEIRPGRLKILE